MNFWSILKAWFIKQIFLPQENIVTILPMSESLPPQPQPNLITKFCLGVQQFEGYIPPCAQYPQGTRAYVCKNPGNLRCSQPMNYLATGCSSDDFCIFPTYETGFKALENVVTAAANGTSKVYTPNMTLLEYFTKRDPSTDANDPLKYATFMANYLNVPITFEIKGLLGSV